MVCENGHTEKISFDLIDTPLFGAILGVPWLQLHNPHIDWLKRNVTLNSAYCIHSCYPEAIDVFSPIVCGLVDGTRDSTQGNLPNEYLEYSDVFDQVKATCLPPHRSFDCKID